MPKYCKTCKLEGHNENKCYVIKSRIVSTGRKGETNGQRKTGDIFTNNDKQDMEKEDNNRREERNRCGTQKHKIRRHKKSNQYGTLADQEENKERNKPDDKEEELTKERTNEIEEFEKVAESIVETRRQEDNADKGDLRDIKKPKQGNVEEEQIEIDMQGPTRHAQCS
ncbi:hypothetical protein H5410_020751 [Solanum commersonii]|uniref:Uncharacterized protein n=1 Tax=Solanum commersonii TaxID=4109 RepID=A0A9J5ZF59_SOLCO|nr:hypothetical protein H5410_020751 [Solanum commersonii]